MTWFCTESSALSWPKRTSATRAEGLDVALDDVLVVAQALRVVLGAALARYGRAAGSAGPERFDRFQEEEEGDRGIEEQ